jgi:hypothetical protein
VIGDPVEAQLDPVEEAEAEGVGQTAPASEADVDAPASEAPLVASRRSVVGVLEPDNVRLRLVECDGDVLGLKAELVGQERCNVTGAGVAR